MRHFRPFARPIEDGRLRKRIGSSPTFNYHGGRTTEPAKFTEFFTTGKPPPLSGTSSPSLTEDSVTEERREKPTKSPSMSTISDKEPNELTQEAPAQHLFLGRGSRKVRSSSRRVYSPQRWISRTSRWPISTSAVPKVGEKVRWTQKRWEYSADAVDVQIDGCAEFYDTQRSRIMSK